MLALATIRPGEPELFAALQGEGASIGRPSVFVRLSRCNLACRWCDTAYTWRFEGDNRPHTDDAHFSRADNQLMLEEEEVAQRIRALGGHWPEPRLVITGGEPLLQGPALARMLAELPGWHVEVETNGTVAAAPALDPLIHQFNVSPKLAHSGNPAELALLPARLAAYAADPRAFFKYVIATSDDIAEVDALVAAHAIPPARVFLMPEGRDAATLHARMAWLADACL
ncbi:MAG TPA: 7-carboxy-7-deazaguanine synthase QueE, partial [Novosphingobium sp.]|nr:7-carboxy-7-deazaguanine synthase QueE [Novosphingobium sp.]